MNRHEQKIAARYGSSMVCLVARCSCDLSHIKSSVYGCSDFLLDGEKFWMQTTNRGIELQRHLGDQPEHVLPWGRVTQHIAALPEALRQRARRVDRLAHTTFPYPQWRIGASVEPAGEELRAWASERYHRVRRLRGAILEAAFPLAYDIEPVDLFDLIEVGA